MQKPKKKIQKKSSPGRAARLRTPRSSEVPVTQAMLFLVRDELKAEIRSGGHRTDSLEARLESYFEKMMSEIHRIGLLVEEQNARNIIVLDGLRSLFDRQERLEARVRDLEG